MTQEKEIKQLEGKELVDAALKFATSAHFGQFRRGGMVPYIEHPKAVASRINPTDHKTVAVALLHDVLEDGKDVKPHCLLAAGFPQDVVDAVVLLTKDPDKSYDDYLIQLSMNEMAKRVKIADMLSNLGDNPNRKQIIRYAKGLLYLVD